MTINNGDTVRVHYTGTLDDGTVFDSSRDREPLEFTMGDGMLIPGFETALLGLSVGDTNKTTISPDDAYGQPSDELILTVPRDQVPGHITPEAGLMLQVETENGMMDVLITDVTEQQVVLDANHPLAGESLTFEIEVLEVVQKPLS